MDKICKYIHITREDTPLELQFIRALKVFQLLHHVAAYLKKQAFCSKAAAA
jgi:hypothetical protein